MLGTQEDKNILGSMLNERPQRSSPFPLSTYVELSRVVSKLLLAPAHVKLPACNAGLPGV